MYKPKVIWFTGLSGAGKTTLANGLYEFLLKNSNGKYICLDGDVLRKGLCSDLGFSDKDRKENIRRVAELASISLKNNIGSICSFISPTREIRNLAKQIIGEFNFIEVYVKTPLEICEKRDVKGLYEKARKGELKKFTGIDSEYQIPKQAHVIIDASSGNIKITLDELVNQIKVYL